MNNVNYLTDLFQIFFKNVNGVNHSATSKSGKVIKDFVKKTQQYCQAF